MLGGHTTVLDWEYAALDAAIIVKKVDEKTAYVSIIIGLVAGFLMFPFPDFSKSLLVGVFFS